MWLSGFKKNPLHVYSRYYKCIYTQDPNKQIIYISLSISLLFFLLFFSMNISLHFFLTSKTQRDHTEPPLDPPIQAICIIFRNKDVDFYEMVLINHLWHEIITVSGPQNL